MFLPALARSPPRTLSRVLTARPFIISSSASFTPPTSQYTIRSFASSSDIPANTVTDQTFASLKKSDKVLSGLNLDKSPYAKAASPERVAAAKAGLEKSGFVVHVVENKIEAYNKLKSLIPANKSINNAHSTTLEEIGFVELMKSSDLPWENVHSTILNEKDPAKQAELRRKLGSTVDYYLTSLSAVTETGEIAHADLSGSKVGGVAFGAGNVIAVVGSNKIVKDAAEAWKRTEQHALPIESARIRLAYGLPGSNIVHYEVFKTANPFTKNRIQIIIVKEALGF